MTESVIFNCLSLIEAKMAARGREFTAGMTELYYLGLKNLPDAEGIAAVEKCLVTSPFIPDVSEILKETAKALCKYPAPDEVYREIMETAERVGANGVPDPERPGITYPGDPPFSHPIVAAVVRSCGGWRMICSGEAQMQEGLSKQVRSAYERILERDYERAIAGLTSGRVDLLPAANLRRIAGKEGDLCPAP